VGLPLSAAGGIFKYFAKRGFEFFLPQVSSTPANSRVTQTVGAKVNYMNASSIKRFAKNKL
jgi:hypothetical protein